MERGIDGFIDAVSESHNAAAFAAQIAHIVFGVGFVADFHRHLHNLFGGAAVRRSFENADAGGNGAVEVCLRGRGNPCAEWRMR